MQVLPIVSMGVQAYGAFSAARGAEKAGAYNAAVNQQRADAQRKSAELEEYQGLKNLEAMVGRQRAQYAASGVSVTTGSPLDVMVDTMSKGLLDISINKYNNELAARDYEAAGQLAKYEAKQSANEYRTRGTLAVLRGAADYIQKYKPLSKKDDKKPGESSSTGY